MAIYIGLSSIAYLGIKKLGELYLFHLILLQW